MVELKLENQSGEKFSHCITSDCLSRLEDSGQAPFDSEVVRDVSGVLFGGKLFLRIGTSVTVLLTGNHSCRGNCTSE